MSVANRLEREVLGTRPGTRRSVPKTAGGEVSASRKRPTGWPPSAGVLAGYAQAYARELGVDEGRVRAWVAYMIMAGILDRATNADTPLFIVKGGVALELRCATAPAPQRTSTSFSGTRLRSLPTASRRR